MEKRLFVKMYGEAARTAGELFGMNPVVILAQGAIESGWGESVLAVKYHNFFGIAGYGVANAYWHGGKTDLGNGDCCSAGMTRLNIVLWILPVWSLPPIPRLRQSVSIRKRMRKRSPTAGISVKRTGTTGLRIAGR